MVSQYMPPNDRYEKIDETIVRLIHQKPHDLGLKHGGGGGTFDGMEPRIAVLEADMKHVKEQLSKLSSVPADLATLKERTLHLPTKAEMQAEISAQLERLGSRMQRQVAITGGIFTVILGAITLAARFLGS